VPKAAGFVLVATGTLVLAWVAVTLQWGDPITAIQTKHEQEKLDREFEQLTRQWRPSAPAGTEPARSTRSVSATPREGKSTSAAALWTPSGVRRWATEFRGRVQHGHAAARIVVPKLNLRMVVVAGTSVDDLKKGPGFYDIRRRGYATALPGMGGVVAIAGHRTTYGHPFRYIETLRKGDRIFLQMPYGRFTYKVYGRRVVSAGNWEILQPRGFEKLVLSACEPLHSLAKWVVYGRLIRTEPPWRT
jgi:sortase A